MSQLSPTSCCKVQITDTQTLRTGIDRGDASRFPLNLAFDTLIGEVKDFTGITTLSSNGKLYPYISGAWMA